MQRRVSFGRYALSVEESGEGAPVVLVHSTGMSAKQWKRLATRLSSRYRALLPDLVGYGESAPWPREEVFHWTLDVLGIEAVLDSLDAPAHVVGHSYGGLVALHATLHRPRAVRSLSLYEPVAYGVLHAMSDDRALTSLDTSPARGPRLSSEPGAAEAWLAWFVDYWNGEGAWSRLPDRMRASFLSTADVCYGEVWSLLSDRTPPSVWSMIEAPTLLLHGESSPEAARRVAAMLAEAIPHATLRAVEGAGHMGPISHEADVSALIEAHLAER